MGYLGYTFMRRLKQLSTSIKNWSKSIKKWNENDRKAWIKEINKIDKIEAKNNLNKTLSLRRLALKNDLNQYNFKKAQVWVQKCKRLWNLDGDENTFFFHKIYSTRQMRSHISSITNSKGALCTTNEDIEKLLPSTLRIFIKTITTTCDLLIIFNGIPFLL